jgi:hypothetical protein
LYVIGTSAVFHPIFTAAVAEMVEICKVGFMFLAGAVIRVFQAGAVFKLLAGAVGDVFGAGAVGKLLASAVVVVVEGGIVLEMGFAGTVGLAVSLAGAVVGVFQAGAVFKLLAGAVGDVFGAGAVVQLLARAILVSIITGAVLGSVVARAVLWAELPAVVGDRDLNDDVVTILTSLDCNLSYDWQITSVEENGIKLSHELDVFGGGVWECFSKIDMDDRDGLS